MKIEFTLTKQDLWVYHEYAVRRDIQRRPLYYLATWILVFLCCWLILTAFWRLTTQDTLLCLAMAFVQSLLGMITSAFNRRRRYFKGLAKTPARLGERVICLGKFDVYWSSPGARGHYYHWTDFRRVTETRTHIYLELGPKGTLIVPQTAFTNSTEAQTFFSEARTRWERMKQRQRYQSPESENVWPPPPRIEV